MRELFRVHKLNEQGMQKAQAIAGNFDALQSKLDALSGPDGREMSIVRTKLEEACFFAKKAMASRAENQDQPMPGPVQPPEPAPEPASPPDPQPPTS